MSFETNARTIYYLTVTPDIESWLFRTTCVVTHKADLDVHPKTLSVLYNACYYDSRTFINFNFHRGIIYNHKMVIIRTYLLVINTSFQDKSRVLLILTVNGIISTCQNGSFCRSTDTLYSVHVEPVEILVAVETNKREREKTADKFSKLSPGVHATFCSQ